MKQTIISPAEIEAVIAAARDTGNPYLVPLCQAINPDHLARAHATKTPVRRHFAFVAVARDALALTLMQRFGLKSFQQLTKAIRAGDRDADFDRINGTAAAALFPSEMTQ